MPLTDTAVRDAKNGFGGLVKNTKVADFSIGVIFFEKSNKSECTQRAV